MCSEFHQINWEGQVNYRDFENQFEWWKCWWFQSQKQETKGAKTGQDFHENKCVQNSTQSMEKVKLQTEIIKINLDLEKAGGLGLKTTMKRDKQGAKFTWKLMCQEFHQVNRKGQVTNRDYEN